MKGKIMIRKLLAVLSVLTVLGSCYTRSAHSDWSLGGQKPLTDDVARDSVYKITVTKEIDVSAIDPVWGLEFDGPTVKLESSGTAWVQGSNNTVSHIMTAGHVCDTETVYDAGMLGQLKILATTYTLEYRDGTLITGGWVMRDDDDVDLCMLSFPGNLGHAFSIADNDPKYGEKVRYIGAPKGHWGGNIALIFEGLFSGRGNPFASDTTYLVITSDGGPGASGSPVIHNGKVVGVLVAGARNFWHFFLLVPHDQLKTFIKAATRGE